MASSLPPGVPLSQIPSGPAPPGVQPLSASAPNHEVAIIVVSALLSALALFFVTSRIYINACHVARKLGWDDYFCVLGLLLCFGYTGLQVSLRRYSRHSWDVPVSWFDETYMKSIYASTMLLGPAQFFAKSSLLLLFLRIFSPHAAMRRTIYCAIAFAFCIYCINIPINSIYCTPDPGQPWGLELGTSCARSIPLAVVQGTLNVVLDLFILIAPMPVISNLRLSKKKKYGVLAVFMTGIFAVVASITGMAYRIILWQNRHGDTSWYEFNSTICVVAETDISLMCSSMPAFASFSKAFVTSSAYLSSLRSRILHPSRSHGSSGSSKTKSPYNAKNYPIQKQFATPSDSESLSHLHDDGYLELSVTPGTGRRTITEIQGSAAERDLEQGVIKKSTSVEQSSRSHQ
ncbi:MAG: hypothetical protein M1837_004625 [Sclerophora amabilis]|nr:MAG: hypothetical protein M1837_004625 [Sclerophora amabilis]